MDGREIIKMAKWFLYRRREWLSEKAPWLEFKEALSEICLAACESLQTYDASKGKESAYVYQAMQWRVRRLVQGYPREMRPLPLLEDDTEVIDGSMVDEGCFGGMEISEIKRIVRESIDDAIEYRRNRNIFKLRMLDGLSCAKIAATYGVSKQRVQQLVASEMERVKAAIEGRLWMDRTGHRCSHCLGRVSKSRFMDGSRGWVCSGCGFKWVEEWPKHHSDLEPTVASTCQATSFAWQPIYVSMEVNHETTEAAGPQEAADQASMKNVAS